MMSAYDINQGTIDTAAGGAVVSFREAAILINRVNSALANIPSTSENDPLVTEYGYTADEAYRLRLVFETLHSKVLECESIMEIAKALTGLQ